MTCHQFTATASIEKGFLPRSVVFLLFALLLASLLPAAPALAASAIMNKRSTVDLTEDGWLILDSSTRGRLDGTPYYEPTCDRPLAAAGLFKRAAELDPDNAKAWHGWGKALDQSALCPAGTTRDWLREKLHLDGYGERPQNFSHLSPKRAAAYKAAYVSAAEKYEKAAALNPDDWNIWHSWAANLFNQAGLEQGEAAIELLKAANGKYAKAFEAADDKIMASKLWAEALLDQAVLAEAENVWPGLLEDACKRFDAYIDMSPERVDGDAEGAPGQRKIDSRPAAIRNAAAALIVRAERLPYDARLKRKKFYSLAVEKYMPRENRTAEQASLPRRGNAPPQLSGDLNVSAGNEFNSPLTADNEQAAANVYLNLALAEEDTAAWREWIKLAENHMDRAEAALTPEQAERRAPFKPGRFFYYLEHETEAQRAQVIVDKLHKAVSDLKPSPWVLTAADNERKHLSGREVSRNANLLRLSYYLPKGPARENAYNAAIAGFEKGLKELDDDMKYLLFSAWGDALARQAVQEKRPEDFEKLVAEADEKFALSDAASSAPLFAGRALGAMAFDREAQKEKDPARKRALLAAAVKAQKAFVESEPFLLSFTRDDYLTTLGDLYLKLFSACGPDDYDRFDYLVLALDAYHQIAALSHDGVSRINMDVNARFNLAQLILYAAVMNEEGLTYLQPEALRQHKKHFAEMPAIIDERDPFAQPWYPPDSAESAPRPTMRDRVTSRAAVNVQAINHIAGSFELNDYTRVQLAGLLRHLAASGMLAPHYQSLYQKRAEDILAEIVAETASDDAPPQLDEASAVAAESGPGSPPAAEKGNGEKRKSDYDQALALAELGFLKHEICFFNGEANCAETAEGDKFWARAEEILPGASRYGRARLAAWRGDSAGVRENLRRDADGVNMFVFPAFEDALYEPAFSEIKNEAWFKDAWFGFGR